MLAGLAGAAVFPWLPAAARGQAPSGVTDPAAVSPLAVERDWSGSNPLRYPDPDVIALDPRFRRLVQFNAPIQRLHTGTLWAEGPAWNGVGRYLVWSDIPNDTQLRWIADDNRVTPFRAPSGNSNGNTFDFQGRQLSCEHGNRRVVRYEHNGTVTVVAERFEGRRLNSPNDLVVHPDGGIWFTDPIFGISGPYEGNRAESELAPAIYRVDPQSGRVDKVTDDAAMPNGLCFSPDYALLYVADRGETRVFDVDGGRRVVRYEPNGTVTVIADKYQGKRLNSPNDIVVHPDGGIWFTDPIYGIRGEYEGYKGEQETKEAVYRIDGKTGQIAKVTDEVGEPNGICFSPDYKRLYVADTGMPRDIKAYDVDGATLRNGKRLIQLDIPGSGAPSAADGIRCDADGNIWAGARPGVQVITPAGERIGMIRLPETCANVCFGGPRRNRLFMTASQSLYSVYVETHGAHIA